MYKSLAHIGGIIVVIGLVLYGLFLGGRYIIGSIVVGELDRINIPMGTIGWCYKTELNGQVKYRIVGYAPKISEQEIIDCAKADGYSQGISEANDQINQIKSSWGF